VRLARWLPYQDWCGTTVARGQGQATWGPPNPMGLAPSMVRRGGRPGRHYVEKRNPAAVFADQLGGIVGLLQRYRGIRMAARVWACGLGGGVLAVCLLAAASAPSAAVASSRSCAVPHSRTLHRLGQIRIYALHNHVYACSRRYGRHVFLSKSRYAHSDFQQDLALGE
jgi:hypothetical protein